ncbi:hypothetical protein ACIBUY_30080 [Streptomyces sp. NPDC050085]|uniref:hypothetical protein n=1 Tax=Streptomyces sp. NPDC050085 TaxID=3365600 RepID=UPI0037A346F6
MPVRTPRPRRLALGLVAVTAVTLGTISASAAQATGTHTPPAATHEAPPKMGGFGIGYRPTKNAPDDVNAANDDFAACMRDRGETAFPGFHATKDAKGRIGLKVRMQAKGGKEGKGSKDFAPTSSAYEKSLKACAPILKKAGITFPASPGNVPGPPSLPGRGGVGGDTKPGAPHDRPGTHHDKPGTHEEYRDGGKGGTTEFGTVPDLKA